MSVIFQTIVTPMMRRYFDYGDFENSLLYLLGGLELVFVSIGMAFIAKRVTDRSFVAVGIALHLVDLVWFLLFIPTFGRGKNESFPYKLIGKSKNVSADITTPIRGNFKSNFGLSGSIN